MAVYYFRNSGVNFGDATNWSLSSGGPADGAVPDATHDAIFDANSGPCTINTSTRACKTLTCTNYTNAFTMSAALNVSGNITFGASMGASTGASSLSMIASGTLTANGHVWATLFSFEGASQTYTIASDMTFGGVLSTAVATTLVTLAGSRTITCNSGVTAAVNLAGVGTTIRIAGGTTSGTFTTCDLVLHSGSITLGNITKTGATFTYTAGTVAATGSTLTLSGTVTTSLGSNVVFGSGTFNSGSTFTFNDDIWIAGTLTLPTAGYASTYISSLNKIIYCWGIAGTSNKNEPFGNSANRPQIVFNGTGNWAYTGNLNLNVTINTAGTLTITGNKTLGSTSGAANLTYVTAAAIVYSSASLNNFGNNTLDCSGMTWPNIQMGVLSRTTTLLSNLNCSGTLTFTGASVTLSCNGFNINTNSLNVASASMNINGTTNIVLNPSVSGTWSHANQPTSFNIPLVINAAGTLTISGTVIKNGLTYTAGTVVSTGSILNWSGTMTINAPGFNLNTLNLLGNSQFLGTDGFTIANLNCTTTGVVSRWTPTNEYIITTIFNSGQADGVSKITYTSTNNAAVTATFSGTVMTVSAVTYGVISVGDTIFGEGIGTDVTVVSFGTGVGGTGTYNLSSSVGVLASGRLIITSPNIASYPKITLQNGATQSLYYTNAIDVDSTNGQTIWSFSGILLRAANWNLLTTPRAHVETWAT